MLEVSTEEIQTIKNILEQGWKKLEKPPSGSNLVTALSKWNPQSINFFETEKDSSIVSIAGLYKRVLFPLGKDYVIKFNDDFDVNQYDDACETEEYIYKETKKLGFQQYFAEIQYIGKVLDIPVYIQERINEFGGRTHPDTVTDVFTDDYDVEWNKIVTKTKAQLTSVSKQVAWYYDSELVNADVFWLNEFKEYVGLDKFCQIMEFLDNHGISDFHHGNVGYKNNVPIFIDYSG